MLDRLEKSDFDPRIGDVFVISLASGESVELRLAETGALGVSTGRDARAAFSLLFRGGPADQYLPQCTYELVHPSMGTLALFLVPLGPDAEGMRYEAVFT